MRIAMLASLAESVPPKLYGGTERVVAWLVDELVARSATMSHCSRAETLGPRESSIRCGQGRSGSVERAQTRAPPAPFLWKRLPNAPPILTSSTPTSTSYRSHCSAGSECHFSLRPMVGWIFRDCPTSFGSFVKQDSFRFPTTSADSSRRRNGSRRSTTACRRPCFALHTTKDPTWRSWGA